MGQVKSYDNILLFIFRAIGILRTNAFQVEHPYLAAQGTSGKAIYPTFSFLSHSCMANARSGFRLSHNTNVIITCLGMLFTLTTR